MNRLNQTLWRWRRAYRYATRKLSTDDAYWIASECADVSGCWPLQSIGVESVLGSAQDRWQDDPNLPRFAYAAASRVASKWPGSDESAAEDWALDLIAEYATQEGITLREHEAEQ
jgi:hypothetical protein